MKYICVLLFFGFTLNLKASDFCKDLKSEQLRIGFIASNLANVGSTRSPEGGHFRPFIIHACTNGTCEVTRDQRSLNKFLPGHPDADKNGYVAFPVVDVASEYAEFNAAVTKIKLLASKKACATSAVVDEGGALLWLSYGEGALKDIKEDIFRIDKNNQVISWSRQDSSGISSSVRFAKNGKIEPRTRVE